MVQISVKALLENELVNSAGGPESKANSSLKRVSCHLLSHLCHF